METAKVVAFTTCETEEQAGRIARALVEKHLVACVNIAGPVRSIYRWKGAIEEANEYLLIVKTEAALMPQLQAALERLHSYEVPELIAMPVTAGSARYLDWISESVSRTPDSGPR